MDKFEQKTLLQMQTMQMVQENDTVAVAFSAGADSTALLLCLNRLKTLLHIRLQAVHINHCLRGEESDREERLARAVCQKLQIPLTVFYAKEKNEPPPTTGLELWAREKRYAVFEKLLQQNDGIKIATAHTANDQAETLLFRLVRGTGLKGSGGIPPVRGRYIRPILWAKRFETEEYCKRFAMEFAVDSSNLKTDFTRNYIRHSILPLLETINPNAVERMAEYCEEMRVTGEYLEAESDKLLKQAQGLYGWQAQVLKDAPQAVADYAFAKICRLKTEPTREKVKAVRKVVCAEETAVSIGKHWHLKNYKGMVLWEKPNPKNDFAVQIPLKEGIFYEKEAFCFKIWCERCETNKNFLQFPKKVLKYCADCDKIPNDTVLRTMRPQDKIRPRGRGVSKLLRKFYSEQKVPPVLRAVLPVLASQNNVLWVWGYGFADGLQPQNAKNVLWAKPICSREEGAES